MKNTGNIETSGAGKVSRTVSCKMNAKGKNPDAFS